MCMARTGKLPPKDAAAFVSMFSQLLRAFEVPDLQEEVKSLERDRAVTELENGPNGNGGGAGRDSEPAPKVTELMAMAACNPRTQG